MYDLYFDQWLSEINDSGLIEWLKLYPSKNLLTTDLYSYYYEYRSIRENKYITMCKLNTEYDLESRLEIEYTNNIKVRQAYYSYENNVAKLNSLYEEYHVNGNISEQYFYIKGKKCGIYKSWYLNGQIKSEATFVDDDVIGLWKSWYLSDEPQDKHSYINNCLWYEFTRLQLDNNIIYIEYKRLDNEFIEILERIDQCNFPDDIQKIKDNPYYIKLIKDNPNFSKGDYDINLRGTYIPNLNFFLNLREIYSDEEKLIILQYIFDNSVIFSFDIEYLLEIHDQYDIEHEKLTLLGFMKFVDNFSNSNATNFWRDKILSKVTDELKYYEKNYLDAEDLVTWNYDVAFNNIKSILEF